MVVGGEERRVVQELISATGYTLFDNACMQEALQVKLRQIVVEIDKWNVARLPKALKT